jgi:NADPH2 dehydrogenase
MTPQASLFLPIRLGGLELANRVVVSPMCQYSAHNGTAQAWHWFHCGSLAYSGAGLLLLEATAVEARGRITPGCLGLYSDENEAALTRLLADIRQYAGTSRIGVQLSHAGRKASTHATWDLPKGRRVDRNSGGWDVVGPTGSPYSDGWPVPHPASEQDMTEIRQAFVDAARRADRAGFDAIELQGAHGYLLHSFQSPLSNQRTDGHGGSRAERLKFYLSVVDAVRAVWPAGKALGVRITGNDWIEGGLSLDDCVDLGHALKAVGVDYLVPSAGNVAPGVNYPPALPGYMVEFARRVRAEVDISTMAVGMIFDAEQAEQIVASSAADMVAIGRAFLDDPRWAWHAAAKLDADVERPPQYARVAPQNWAGYRPLHGVGPDLAATAMGHASRD